MPSNDPDINNEPHLRPGGIAPNYDPAIDAPLGFDSLPTQFSQHSEEDIDHSVWDEPSLRPEVSAAVPESALTYGNWLKQRRESWTEFNAWTVTLGVILLSFPMAVAAAIINWTTGNVLLVTDVFVACAAGPMLQEICKIAVPLWIVEKRPYFFTTWFQFFLFALATATVFTVVSNFIFSLVIQETSTGIFIFQWVVVFGLNLVTASISTYGLETIWRNCINSGKPPKLDDGYLYFATAIGLHVVFAIVITICLIAWDINRLLSL